MHNERGSVIIRSRQSMLSAFADYVALCGENGAFPNLAGFCRHCQIGEEGMEKLRKRFPDAYDFIVMSLEDEALNADKSASLVTAYLKRRLGYSESPQEDEGPTILIDRRLSDDGA